MKYSSTNWETSYFGGFERVLWDHPEITVPYDISFDTPNTKDVKGLSSYTREKILKLFLLKVAAYNQIDTFLKGSKIEETSVFGFTKRKLVMDRYNVIQTLDYIISADTELGNLFSNYSNFIKGSVFKHRIDPKKPSCPPGSGPNSGDENSSSQDGTSELERTLADALKSIKAINVRKRYTPGNSSSVSGKLKTDTIFSNVNKSNKSLSYTEDETKNAANLVRMLDISFDPKMDKIPNLKAGKLTVQKIAEIPAGNTHVYHREEENQTTKPFSVCILCDESGSMYNNDMNMHQHRLVRTLYKAFTELMSPNKLFIYGHSGVNEPEIRVYNEMYNPVFEYTIQNQLHNDYHENYDGPVIECIYERVRAQTSDNIIFICISDGEPSGHNYGGEPAVKDLRRVIEKCKRDGFVTVGIGLNYGRVKDIYQYFTIINDPTTLVKNVSGLINRVVKSEFQD